MANTVSLPDCARELLRAIYPTIRWEHVTFHSGLPAVIRNFTRFAVTFPDPLSFRHIRIFISEAEWKRGFASVELLGTLVHECYHVVQYQQRLRGLGLGPVRPFVLQYLVASIGKGGGMENRFEKPAYDQEKAFLNACRQKPPLAICAAATSDATRAATQELLRRAPALVTRKAAP